MRAPEWVKGPEDCPELKEEKRPLLEKYLSRFQFDMQ